MQTKYETKIKKIGSSITDFLGEKILVLFGENAPAELVDYCLLINVNNVQENLQAGDMLQIGDNCYKITAVGSAVETNLSELGHITLIFDGSNIAELPGSLYLEEVEIKEVKTGDSIQIYRR